MPVVRPGVDLAGLRSGAVLANEQRAHDDERRRAALVVASRSVDARECRELLEMLGLRPRRGASSLPSTDSE